MNVLIEHMNRPGYELVFFKRLGKQWLMVNYPLTLTHEELTTQFVHSINGKQAYILASKVRPTDFEVRIWRVNASTHKAHGTYVSGASRENAHMSVNQRYHGIWEHLLEEIPHWLWAHRRISIPKIPKYGKTLLDWVQDEWPHTGLMEWAD
ncbi:MAG TPA: hypothetical protein DCE41_04620 [Cytophagales bacterium]|nr:hypothetical protein [Cytophagales bacterium]HAA23086.1 hypothetical protein [Cytophagales bacterium]HAP64283.1 hypothetical protein [Cytophagales bacterium]